MGSLVGLQPRPKVRGGSADISADVSADSSVDASTDFSADASADSSIDSSASCIAPSASSLGASGASAHRTPSVDRDTTSMLPTIALMVSGIQMLPVPPVRPFQRHARRSLVTFVVGTLVGTLTTNAVWTTLSRSADGVRKRTARSCATAALAHSHASVSRTGTMSRRSA